MYIREDGGGALVEKGVGGRDEAEGGGDDVVAFTDAEGFHAKMQSGSAAACGDGVAGADIRGEFLFEFSEAGTEAELAGAKSAGDVLDFAFANIGTR